MAQQPDIREVVRQHYAGEATRFAARAPGTSCCGASPATGRGEEVAFGRSLYGGEAGGIPEAAVNASLGCGVPTAVADLHPGEVVLDLGSGAGADVLISARRVAPGGRAIGLDMTTEMLELARKNADDAGLDNVEFLEGYLEDIPLPDASVDVVLSNCVINLAAKKGVVLHEAARVLRGGGRFAVTDVIADPDLDPATKADMEQWAGCLAGALTEAEYRAALAKRRLHGRGGDRDPPRPRPRHLCHSQGTQALVASHGPLGLGAVDEQPLRRVWATRSMDSQVTASKRRDGASRRSREAQAVKEEAASDAPAIGPVMAVSPVCVIEGSE